MLNRSGRYAVEILASLVTAFTLLTFSNTAHADVALLDGWTQQEPGHPTCRVPCDSATDCPYTPSAGSNRLLVYAWHYESNMGDSPITVTFGGVGMTQGATTYWTDTTWHERTQIFYLAEKDWPGGGPSWDFLVSGYDVNDASHAHAATFTGVDPDNPILDTGTGSATASTSLTSSSFNVRQGGMALALGFVSSGSAGNDWSGNTPAWTEGTEVGACSLGTSGANTTAVYSSDGTDTVTVGTAWNELQMVTVASLAPLTTEIYYSVGTETLALYSDTASATSGVLTLGNPAADRIGVGDEIRVGAGADRYYITQRNSATEFLIQNSAANGGTPGATNISFGSQSITIYRAYNTLADPIDAVSGSNNPSNANHLNTSNLVSGGFVLNLACYADGLDDLGAPGSQIVGWVTGSYNHIRVFTPVTSNEVGTSQRHNGKWDPNAGYAVTSSNATRTMDGDALHIRIDGLQIRNTGGGDGLPLEFSASPQEFHVSNSIFYGLGGGIGLYANLGNSSSIAKFWNNIVHDWSGDGIHVHGNNLTPFYYAYNNTVYNTNRGLHLNWMSGTNKHIKNNLSYNNTTDYSTNGGSGFNGTNLTNLSSDATSPNVALRNMTVSFVDAVGGDLHLASNDTGARDAGTDLSADTGIVFSNDIDMRARQTPWDIGADELEATFSFRSIGTAANYTTGTVTTTLGSAVVTGSGTGWQAANRGWGDRILINGTNYTILSVDSDTLLTLTTPASGTFTGGHTIARQFTTLQAWEDCVSFAVVCPFFPVASASLVADNRSEFGIAYNDTVFTAGVDIDGSTTDTTHRITLTVAPGNRHNGTPGAGVVLDGGNTLAQNVDLLDDYTRFEWFELRAYKGGDGNVVGVAAQNVEVNHLIVHDFNDQPINPNIDGIAMPTLLGTYSLTVRNSFIYDGGGACIQGDSPDDTVLVENTTVYGCVWGGIFEDAGSVFTVRNTIAMGNGLWDFNVPGGVQSNNISADATASGPGSLTGQLDTDVFVTPGVNLHLKSGVNPAVDAGLDLSTSFWSDIDGQSRLGLPWDIGADERGAPTAVSLASFTATGLDGEVLVEWETASELNNLGFHVYRSTSSEGAYQRLTSRPIPGLGSSPVGARYSYRDTGLTNGVLYHYELEDIETTGRTELHGPVSARPVSSGSESAPVDGGEKSTSPARITYGEPSGNSLRVVKRGRRQVVLELVTEGFYADPQEDGSVRLDIPGFEELSEADGPGVPAKRTWVEALAGRKVKLVSVKARGVEVFTGLRPSDAEVPEIVATRQGTVRLRGSYGGQVRRLRRPVRRSLDEGGGEGGGLYPSEAARIVSVGFQGEVKKALVELAPLRWDGTTGQLLLARRLVVRLSFAEREPAERSTDGVRGRRQRKRRSQDERRVVARLATTARGLHSVRYEEVMRGRRGVRASALRLSRQGEAVAFHLEPKGHRFKPGSELYFVSEGAAANPFGGEAVYELEVGRRGEVMADVSAAPGGEPAGFYWHRAEWEQNRYYQAALVDAPDVWLWDLVFAPEVKRYPIEVSALAASSEASKLSVWLQGVSDFRANPDHHVRVYVNGSLVEELSWDGKQAKKLEVELAPGLLRDVDNVFELENVGDTEAAYSMVMLDRFAVEYPRLPVADQGRLEGRWSETGTGEVAGFAPGAYLLDTSGAQPSWLTDTVVGADATLRFRAESGRRYLAVSPEAVHHPAVTKLAKPRASRLKNTKNRADYLVIGPAAFVEAATPLVELRKSEGLKVKPVSIEDVYAEFGFGETTPEAVKDFLSYAYHHWRQPSPRYVLLLGDATYDPKDYLGTGVINHVPSPLVKTTYLWTASDPSYAAVNGEDLLPDLAIGRLPAATVKQIQTMVRKIVAYETSEAGLHQGAVVLVADNPDRAGNFEADADRLAQGVLASKNPKKIYVSELGTTATRNAIVQSFDEGASLLSYLGHGGIHLWADENFFNASDVASLGPQSQQPLVLTMNCLNGYFHFPYFNSLAEELVKTDAKGAIAAFSPSGLSLNHPANRYHQALLKELFNGDHPRLGDAVLAAQEAYAQTGAFPELLSIYHLLGDPALRIR